MQESTRKKIEEIRKLISEGATERDIIKSKFRNSPKAYGEWYDKFGDYLQREAVEVIQKPLIEPEPQGNISIFEPRELLKLKDLLNNADDLLALLHQKREEKHEEIHVLSLPDEIKELNDIEYKSFRVSRELVKQFDQLADNHKQFTKTALINLALKEFIDKYKQ